MGLQRHEYCMWFHRPPLRMTENELCACNNLSHMCQWIEALRSVIMHSTVLVRMWTCVLLCECVNEHGRFELTVISWSWPSISSCCWISWSRLSCPLLSFISCRTFSPGCRSPSHFQLITSEPWPWYTTDMTVSHRAQTTHLTCGYTWALTAHGCHS